MPIVDTETHEAMTAALDIMRRRLHLFRTALDEYRRECETTAEAFAQHVAACEADPELAAKVDRSFVTVVGFRQLAETNRQAAMRTAETMAELDAFEEAHTW